MEISEEKRVLASNALHKILTTLNVNKRKILESWDYKNWELMHQLIVLLAMRKQYAEENWALEIACQYSLNREIIDMDISFLAFTLAGEIYHVHPDELKTDSIRIHNALTEKRNILLLKQDTAFTNLLVNTDLCMTGLYREGQLHIEAKKALLETKELLGSQYIAHNLQFEISKQVTEKTIQDALFVYFAKKELVVVENSYYCSNVYDKNYNNVFNTSISILEGTVNNVALVTIDEPKQ